MSKYWIKLWIEILSDDEMGVLPDNVWRRAVECFLMAGKIDAGGRLPPLRRMARITYRTVEDLEKELEHLINVGIIGKDDDGYFVVNFAKRQAPVSAARRVREHRRRQDVTKRYTGRNETVTKNGPEDRRTESTTTTTELGDYVVKYLSKGRVSSATAELVQSILDTYAAGDIAYAVREAERKAATTNDPPTLEYIEAICKRRQRGEPDQPKGQRNGQKKRSGKSQQRTIPPAQGAGGGRIEADKPAGISLD